MKQLIIIASFAAFIVFAVSCSSGTSKANYSSEIQKDSVKVYYTCTMHPEVHSDKPGNCPKCGMELVKKEVTKSDSTQIHHHADSMKMN